MAKIPYIGYNQRRKAERRFYRKDPVFHRGTGIAAILEMKIWDIQSHEYPDGVKYSCFLVLEETGEIVVGMDNHFPKGPHLHIWTDEWPYVFFSVEQLFRDFKKHALEEGFVI